MIFFSVRLIYLLLCGDPTHLSWQNKPQTSPFISAGFVWLQGQEEGKETWERNVRNANYADSLSEASLLPPPHLTFFICCFFPPSSGSSESGESLITSANGDFLIKSWLCKNLKKLSGSRVSLRPLQDIKVGPSTCQQLSAELKAKSLWHLEKGQNDHKLCAPCFYTSPVSIVGFYFRTFWSITLKEKVNGDSPICKKKAFTLM